MSETLSKQLTEQPVSYGGRAGAGTAVAPAIEIIAEPSFAVRFVEVSVAFTALVVTAPILSLVWLIIRLDSPGRGLFWQQRLGAGAKPFKFLKFRTMHLDARKRFPELYKYSYTPLELEELRFKKENDPRVTRQGRWLRKSTLDELPNFWNVLTGEMALVGPRPEIPEMLPYYTGEMRLKFAVRPGITGLAQVRGRGRLGFYETVALDVEYVKTRTVALDVKIFLTTILKMITRDGAF